MNEEIKVIEKIVYCCSAEAPCEQNNSDPKKLGKAKKPDANLVRLVFPV